jgi:hypothetical protein
MMYKECRIAGQVFPVQMEWELMGNGFSVLTPKGLPAAWKITPVDNESMDSRWFILETPMLDEDPDLPPDASQILRASPKLQYQECCIMGLVFPVQMEWVPMGKGFSVLMPKGLPKVCKREEGDW